jgi:hypothetical protein
MGTFAETAIVDYHLTFADQGKTFLFRSCFQQTNASSLFPFLFAANKRKFPFSLSSIFRLRNSGIMLMKTWGHQTENESPGDFP